MVTSIIITRCSSGAGFSRLHLCMMMWMSKCYSIMSDCDSHTREQSKRRQPVREGEKETGWEGDRVRAGDPFDSGTCIARQLKDLIHSTVRRGWHFSHCSFVSDSQLVIVVSQSVSQLLYLLPLFAIQFASARMRASPPPRFFISLSSFIPNLPTIYWLDILI